MEPAMPLLLTFGPLTTDVPRLDRSSPAHVMISVVAELSISVDGQTVLHEPTFPVIELALALRRWLEQRESAAPPDFAYESLEADEKLLELHRERDGWRIESPWFSATPRLLGLDELLMAAQRFVTDVHREVLAQMQIDIWQMFPR